MRKPPHALEHEAIGPRNFSEIWALLFGIALLMLANVLPGTRLGVRAEAEGVDSTTTGLMMSGFFVGLLVGSLWTPYSVRIVGHIRVFAAVSAIASVSILLQTIFVDALFRFAFSVSARRERYASESGFDNIIVSRQIVLRNPEPTNAAARIHPIRLRAR